MKTKIFTLLGIVFLFFSCQKELLDLQEDSLQSFSMSSQLSASCEPDFESLHASLPNSVSIQTTANPGDDAYFDFDILNTDLAATGLQGWCGDVDGYLEVEGPYEFNVYSSYEDFPTEEFENPQNFPLVNWILNQDFIGKVSSISGETYTYGMVQWAIWELLDDNNCVNCFYLTGDVKDGWKQNRAALEAVAMEIVDAAVAEGQDFKPDCGQQVALMFIANERNPLNQIIQSIIYTVDVPEKVEDCTDCEGNVTELELKYNGDEEAHIVVKTKDEGENGSKVVFKGNVAPGGTFTFMGNDENGTLGEEIKVYVDGDYVKIKTDCSEAIGPGLIIEDIEVISGKSSNGAYLCPIPCDECKGGVTSFTVEYTGSSPAQLKVAHKDAVLFNEMINPGQLITLSGSKDDGKFEENNLIFTLNGTAQSAPGHDSGKIHVSCSKPFYVGLPIGDSLVVTAGRSKDNGEMCAMDEMPCDECDGGVTSFTMEYTGLNNATLKVEHKDAVLFNDTVMPGQLITLSGSKDDGKFEENNLIISLNGVVLSAPEHDPGKIHVSCSKPFYVGLPIGDSLVVTAGTSKDNGPICEDIPPMQPGCQECDGKITRLDLQYNGSGSALIKVIQKKDGLVAFNSNVNPGETFTFSGKDDKGTLGTEIIIYVNGSVAQKIHTSCSEEIGAGSIFGNFTVIGGASRNGGELCPVNTPPSSAECDCDGKIVSMAVEYSGPSGATVTVGADEDGNNAKTFTNVQAGDVLNVTLGEIGNWWYWSVNGDVQGSIHTSCSDDILGNVDAEKSDFGNMGTYPNPEFGSNNGTFLVVMHTDDKGNTCTLDGYNVEVLPMDSPTSGSTECDCDGKIVKMSVKYDGPSGAVIVVTGDKGGSQTFNNVSKGAVITPTLGAVGNWWYYSVNGNLQASIHTSCSDDILGNVDASKSIFGDMGSYPDPADDDGNKNDGTFLVTSHTDEEGNTCSLTDGH